MNKKAIYRHELKFQISNSDRDIQEARMRDILSLDAHGGENGYLIRSLYFDDYWESAYEEKLMGTATRKKYRIRIYDHKDSVIKLECKNKQGSYIYKKAADITREEFYKILQGEFRFLLQHKEAVCHEFYVACTSDMLRPRVIVDYDRTPYVYDAGTVRITFDSHVRAAVGSYDIFDRNIPTIEVMPANQLIMEVKYTECLPQIIQNIIPQDHGEYIAASKYCMCYEEKMRFIR